MCSTSDASAHATDGNVGADEHGCGGKVATSSTTVGGRQARAAIVVYRMISSKWNKGNRARTER